ncbi:MAG: insulinase family protein [Rhodobacteraceae bacterium]|nr:insulinase family protein [Paracoccaceae bacterium]
METSTKFYATYLIHTPDTERVEVYLIIQNGEADNTGRVGLTHYTEHLAWLSAIGQKGRAVDRDANAWTDDLAVGYWLTGAREDLPELLASLSEVFSPIDLPQGFMSEERDVILREYDLRLTNNIDGRVDEAVKALIYEGSTYARSVMGTQAHIAAFDPQAAIALHDKTHRPENTVLVVVGDITPEQLNAALPDVPVVAPTPPPLPTLTIEGTSETVLTFPDPNADPRMVWRRIVTLDDPQSIDVLETRLALLRDILDSSLPGGLDGPLRYDAFIARGFDIDLWPLDETHIEMSVTAYPDVGIGLAEMQHAFEAALEASARAGIPEETYTRVKARFKKYWPDWTDESEVADWMAAYTIDRVSIRRAPLEIDAIKQLDQQLERDEINALLRTYTQDGRTVVAFIGNEKDFP